MDSREAERARLKASMPARRPGHLTAEELIAFEEDIRTEFLKGNIRAPVHFCDPNQAPHLIEIFQDIGHNDWVFATWRSHMHALLHGVPPKYLKEQMMAGRSMSFCSEQYRFVTSSIVGGIVPMAVGTAMGIKRLGINGHVHCFIGDMTSLTGIFYESLRYATNFALPIRFYVEDNGLSTDTDTKAVWGLEELPYFGSLVECYEYERNVAHVGAGQWVTFS